MDPISLLIIVAMIAWFLQILLGWLQVKAFNKEVSELAKQGSIGIGKTASRFKPRTIIVISVSSANIISGAFVMRGLSIFSRPKALPSLVSRSLSSIDPKQVFPSKPAFQEALSLAISEKQ